VLIERFKAIATELQFVVQWNEHDTASVQIPANTWSRRARRHGPSSSSSSSSSALFGMTASFSPKAIVFELDGPGYDNDAIVVFTNLVGNVIKHRLLENVKSE